MIMTPVFEVPQCLKNSFPNAMPTTVIEAYCKKSVIESAKDS